jgi:hypothetical protein
MIAEDTGKKLFKKLRAKYDEESIEKQYEQDKLDELYLIESEGGAIDSLGRIGYNKIMDCYGYTYKCSYGNDSFMFYVYKDKSTVDNDSAATFPDDKLYDMLF